MRWTDLVFNEVRNHCNAHGSRTFTLEDFIKDKLPVFTAAKPENNNPEAKVRQQLQFLRDQGKISFLDNSGNYTLREIYLLDDELEETKTIDLSKEEPEKREYLLETYVRRVKWAKMAVDRLGDRCLCQGCKNTFYRPDNSRYIEVHHIIPLFEGGEDAIWNLAVLCAHHHKKAHYSDTKSKQEMQAYLQAEVDRRIKLKMFA